MVLAEASSLAKSRANGLSLANAMTKRCIHQQCDMSTDVAIQARVICMQTRTFGRAYHAFVAKARPAFRGD